MLGDSRTVFESSGEATAAVEGGSVSGEEDKSCVGLDEEGDRMTGLACGRWPREETLALLRIRFDMDAAFRDSTLKAPLWEEISRKLAELGYNRSAKKCKEKFENVYKYHKRTKEGRTGIQEGKTYRFFDQLQALENLHSLQSEPNPKASRSPTATTTTTTTTTTTAFPSPWINPNTKSHMIGSVSSTLKTLPTLPQPENVTPSIANHTMLIKPYVMNNPNPYPNLPRIVSTSNLFFLPTSSTTASEEELEDRRSRKKRKYWKRLFRRLTKEVIEKQEEMQRSFLETLERREIEKMACEESWRAQETRRISKEHEILVQERSSAMVKDATLISFLQKISGKEQPRQPPHKSDQQRLESVHQQQVTSLILLHRNKQQDSNLVGKCPKLDNGETNPVDSSPSRWSKAEVEALISLRMNLDMNYQDNAPKGPLWEEISASMRRLGYNRSAKRCKEKWENINKYFKKVQECNKTRSEDSKTCPYFYHLDAIYKQKNKIASLPLMVEPEKQLLPPQEDPNRNEREKEEDQEDGDGKEEDDEGGGVEMMSNKTASSMDAKDNIV